ncbi:G-protein coupled receptor 87-like isoform X2 [Scophthalmus maximus]|uniref:G-protein coupled receptor 87-like isoform X2 n=1 Tax=Scophthalmus maximus TaxID=52904 RepID=UPI001FA8B78C|nr:G-protein coupled receptor 87-like isoform X2 [Scophthalmus maximus]
MIYGQNVGVSCKRAQIENRLQSDLTRVDQRASGDMSDLGGVGATSSADLSSVTSEMNASSATRCRQAATSPHVFLVLVYSLLFLVGLLLNGFALRVYFCRAKQTTSSVTVYLKNLAASDFLLSLCLPVRIINYASSSVPVHQVYCSFGSSAFYLNMYASILFMGFIAAHRYLKIVHPLGTHFLQTVRAARVISTLTWVFLLSMSSTYISLSLSTWAPVPSVPGAVSCGVLRSLPLRLFYKIIHTCSAAIFLLVLVSLVLFYHDAVLVEPGLLLPEGAEHHVVRSQRLPGPAHLLHLLQGLPGPAEREEDGQRHAGHLARRTAGDEERRRGSKPSDVLTDTNTVTCGAGVRKGDTTKETRQRRHDKGDTTKEIRQRRHDKGDTTPQTGDQMKRTVTLIKLHISPGLKI